MREAVDVLGSLSPVPNRSHCLCGRGGTLKKSTRGVRGRHSTQSPMSDRSVYQFLTQTDEHEAFRLRRRTGVRGYRRGYWGGGAGSGRGRETERARARLRERERERQREREGGSLSDSTDRERERERRMLRF